jgi:Putative DNA-binding domain
MKLAKLQSLFQQALLTDEPSSRLQQHITADHRLSADQRLNIYRHSRQAVLINALKHTYPVCLALVGESCFNGLTKYYVTQQSESSVSIQAYGACFADFIDHFPSVDSVPYLADVARLEWGMSRASTGADASAIDFAGLARVTEAQQKNLCFQLPDNATLLASDYPVDRIWELHQTELMANPAAPTVNLPQGEVKLIIWRKQLEVLCERLTQEQWFVLQAIQNGHNFADICRQYVLQPQWCPIDDILPVVMTRGWISKFTIKSELNL